MPGLALLSASTVGPEGLDIRTTRTHHVVGRLGLKCPRAELGCQRGQLAGAGVSLQQCAEENLTLRCVGEEVYIPEGQWAEVQVTRPPHCGGRVLWLGPPSDDDGEGSDDEVQIIDEYQATPTRTIEMLDSSRPVLLQVLYILSQVSW